MSHTKLLVTLGLALALAMPAAADVVKLKSGRTLEGKVIEAAGRDAASPQSPDGAVAPGAKLTLQTRFGSVTIDRAEVESIEYCETLEERIERGLNELAESDATDAEKLPAYMSLAREASDQGWPAMWRDIVAHVLALDPGYVPAREALGYQLVDGKWMTEDEQKVAQGLVKFKGRWVHPDEVRATEAADYWRKMQRGVDKLVKKMGSKVRSRREAAYEEMVAMQGQIPGIVEAADTLRDYYDRYYRALAARGEVVAEIRATNAALRRPIETFQTSLATGSVFSVATQVQIQVPELNVTAVKTTVAIPAVEEDEE